MERQAGFIRKVTRMGQEGFEGVSFLMLFS